MNKKKPIKESIEELLQDNRLDEILQCLINLNSWDDLLLAFSNVCVFAGNREKTENKTYKSWLKKAMLFHDAIDNLKKASVQAKRIRKEFQTDEPSDKE